MTSLRLALRDASDGSTDALDAAGGAGVQPMAPEKG